MRIGIDASRAFVEQPTGTERYANELIKEMLKIKDTEKIDWILYTKKIKINPDTEKFLKFAEKTGNVKVVTIPMTYLWTQIGLAGRTWVDKLDVLWIPAHTLPLFRRGIGGLGKRLKTVVTIHGIEYEWLPAFENRLQRWYLPLSTRYAAAAADRLIAVSEFTKEQLEVRLGANPEKIQVIHEGYVMDRLGTADKEDAVILEKYGLAKQKYLLFVGTIQPRKNLVRLIEAFSRLSDRSLKLAIAGRLGWQYEEVLAAPEKFKVKERVVMPGYITDKERQGLIRNCLAYVQPSITEGFGLPVLEAMAMGAAVALSSGGALKEFLRFGKSNETDREKAAEVFDPLDVSQMAGVLEKLSCGGELYRKNLGKKAIAISRRFTWEDAAQKTLEILTSIS